MENKHSSDSAIGTYSRIEGPDKQPPHGSTFHVECRSPKALVSTFDEVTEGADVWNSKLFDVDEDDEDALQDHYMGLKPLKIDSFTMGNSLCLLRGGCFAHADKENGRVTIANPVTGKWMVLADGLRCPGGLEQAHDTSIIVAGWAQVFRIQLTGEVTALCGHPTQTGFADGVGEDARFDNSTAVTLTHDGLGVLVNDRFNSAVRKVLWNGAVTTLAVSRDKERYGMVESVAACPDGSYVFSGWHRLMKLTEDGIVTPLFGDGVERREGPAMGVAWSDIGTQTLLGSLSTMVVSSNGIVVFEEGWGDGTFRLLDLQTGGVQTVQCKLPHNTLNAEAKAAGSHDCLESLEWNETCLVINKDGDLIVSVPNSDTGGTAVHRIKLDNIPNIGSQFSTFKGWGAPWLKPNRACIRSCSPKVKRFMLAVLSVATRAKLQSLASAGRRSTRSIKHWRSLVLPTELWHHIIEMVLPPPCSAVP